MTNLLTTIKLVADQLTDIVTYRAAIKAKRTPDSDQIATKSEHWVEVLRLMVPKETYLQGCQ